MRDLTASAPWSQEPLSPLVPPVSSYFFLLGSHKNILRIKGESQWEEVERNSVLT